MGGEDKIIPLHMHPLGLIETFLYFGATRQALLRGVGISDASLARREIQINYAQQCQLIKNGIKACGLNGLGLRVGLHQDWCHSGSVGNIVTCSTSLREANAAFRRYALIAQPHDKVLFSSIDSYMDQNNVLVSLVRTLADEREEPELARFELEYRMAVAARLYNLCGNARLRAGAVHLGFHYAEPANTEFYQELPCAAIQFNCARSYIAAPRDYVTEVWRPLRAHCFARLMKQCEAEFENANLSCTYAEKVRWYLSAYFHAEQTIDDVAGALGLSVRGLSRRLALEKTSFRQLFHSVKMELVCLHLRYSSLQVNDIAELTGFSCSSSLRRAVRSWREQAPQAVNHHNWERAV